MQDTIRILQDGLSQRNCTQSHVDCLLPRLTAPGWLAIRGQRFFGGWHFNSILDAGGVGYVRPA